MVKEPDRIWTARLDNRFTCEVVRSGETTGTLTVYNGDSDTEPIFSTEVGLAYGAIFGPDIDDVMSWQDIVLTELESRGLIPPATKEE